MFCISRAAVFYTFTGSSFALGLMLGAAVVFAVMVYRQGPRQ